MADCACASVRRGSSLEELVGAVEQTHTRIGRLGELESDQHGMVLALRGQLADAERDVRRHVVEAKMAVDAAVKHREEMAALRMQLKQTEEKYVAEKRTRENERAEGRALARNQVTCLRLAWPATWVVGGWWQRWLRW